MGEYLTFEKMIAPVVIQILFWVGVVGIVLSGLFTLFSASFISGLLMIIIGPIVVRVYCEVLLVFFRILDNLREININTRKG
jgi:hypothetical protein